MPVRATLKKTGSYRKVSTVADCKRSVEVEIPVDEVERARERVTNSIRQKVRLPGFRPGKAPASMIESRFESDIRQEILEQLLPHAFRQRVEKDALQVVGQPNISELQFEKGQPIRFKADFEVAPEFEIAEYRGLPVKYEEPEAKDEEVAERLETMRERKAEYVNLDPRAIEDKDFVLVNLKSVSGLAEGIEQDTTIEVGGADTFPSFSEALTGANPGETKEAEIAYPEDYGEPKLAGKTVRFELTPRVIQKKELPELDDEFARDLGDYQTLDELRDAVRKSIFHEKQHAAQQVAKEALIDRLVEANDFPIPETYVNRQIENQLSMQLRQATGRDVDLSKLNLDWTKVKEKQRDPAVRSVKASLLLEKISDREGIKATKDEVDREVQRIANQQREPIAVTRARLDKDGTLGRIASHIQTEKTLQLLFEQAQKQV
jgi:trigger factor